MIRLRKINLSDMETNLSILVEWIKAEKIKRGFLLLSDISLSTMMKHKQQSLDVTLFLEPEMSLSLFIEHLNPRPCQTDRGSVKVTSRTAILSLFFFFCWHWWPVKRWGHEGVAISIIVPARIIHLYWRVLDVLKNNSYNYPKCPSKCLSTYSLWAVLSELGNSDFGVQLERTIRFSTQTCHKMENYLLLMSQCLPQHWEEQDDGSVISPPQGAFLTRGSIYDLTQSLSSGRFSLRWAVTRNLFTVQTCELTPIREEKNQSGRNSILAKFFYLG